MSSAQDPGRSWDPIWDSIFGSMEWGKYPPEYVIRFVARSWYQAPNRKDVRILELGCGSGAIVWYLSREGFSAYGIDGSRIAIEKARERLALEGLAANLHAADYGTLPWPDDHFDGVIDNVSLYCNSFRYFQQVVGEVKRTLKPGGRFLSASFTDRTWGYGTGKQVGPGEFVDIQEGPLKGRGFTLFQGRIQLEELFRPFADVSVELCSWTAMNMQRLIELWIVQMRKA